MTDIQTAILVILALVFFVTALNLRLLQEGKVAVVERLGVFYKIVNQPGIFFLFPILDRVVETVDMKEQQTDIKYPEHELSIRMIYKIIDAKMFVYASLDTMKTLKTFIETIYLKYHQLKDEQIKEIIEMAESFGIEIKDFIVI